MHGINWTLFWQMKSTAIIIVMGKRIRPLLWLQIHALVKCCFVRLWSTQCDQVAGGRRGCSVRANCRVCCVLKWVCRVFWLFMWFAAGRGSRISLGLRWGTPVEVRGFCSLPTIPGVVLCGKWESLCVLNRVTSSYLDRNGTNYEGNWWK